MEIFGNQNVESSSLYVSNFLRGTKFTCSEAGTAQSITAYIDTSATGKILFAIYKSSDSSLVGYTEEGTDLPTGWQTLDIVAGGTLEATDYYIVSWANAGYKVRYKSQTYAGAYMSKTYTGTPPDPWSKTLGSYMFSIYCTYSIGGGQTHYGAATLSGTGALSALGRLVVTAKATLSGTGSLLAAGTVLGAEVTGSATLSGTGSLAAAPRRIRSGKGTLSGTGALAAAGHVTRAAAATMAGTGELAAAAVIVGEVTGSATLSGTGSLSARAVYIVIAKATLSGTGSLHAAATIVGTSPTLLAAQKKRHRLPYVEAKLYDYSQGIKRLHYTRLYQGSEPDNHHGLAFDGQGSMHRIRAAAGNKLYRQKVANPGPGSDYSQWTEIATDCAGPCAIAASGGKVYIFYRKTDDTLRKYYSHNYGQDWTNAELTDYAGALSLAAAWWGTSDTVVCFALRSNQLNGITLDTSDQSTTPHTWSDGNHIWLTTCGIGATYNAALDQCELVIAGKESDSPYNHHDLFRTRFNDNYNFLALASFITAPDGEDITYEYPDCHLPASPQAYETNRVAAVEKFAGTTAYTRPVTCHCVKGTTWSDTTFTEPRPLLDESAAYGFRISSTPDHWWMETPSGVWRAARPAADPLDLTGDIVALTADSSQLTALRIELDNSKGKYASPGEGELASLLFRSEIVLKLGYKTTQGNEAVDAGTYWIDSWEYSTNLNQSLLNLYCLDGWGLMDRWTARYHMRWNKDDVDPRSVWQVLYQVLARVGIRLTNTPAKPQSSAINNLYPDFALDPGTGGDAAIRRLLSFVPDKLVFRGQEAFTKNPLSNEASSYSYGTDHVIVSGTYGHAVTLSRSRALGQDDEGARIVEDALDWDLLELAIDELGQVYDPNLRTATRAQERADALLRQASLSAYAASLVVPTNVAQQLLDVVDVTDARCGISAENYRVEAIRTDYDRRKGQYHQTLTLGAP